MSSGFYPVFRFSFSFYFGHFVMLLFTGSIHIIHSKIPRVLGYWCCDALRLEKLVLNVGVVFFLKSSSD